MPFDLHVSLLEMLEPRLCDSCKTPNELHHLNDAKVSILLHNSSSDRASFKNGWGSRVKFF
jgi:hypothetical protein